ncbi:hypothetical protein DQ392_18520 [Streptomyces reniochalinae]|uniref:Uncharacterized protein n=1 Tax=Streptomyces reniochalinae TaxID=2250578 RepID=A0A367EH66_9ACTN|nr:hypothetical protein DQ392_18520 [Streptomyces reniochalinae]
MRPAEPGVRAQGRGSQPAEGTNPLRGVSAPRLSILTGEATIPDRQREANGTAAAALDFTDSPEAC